MGVNRRGVVIGGAAAVLTGTAHAGPLPAALSSHPGYRAWERPRDRATAPLDAMIDQGGTRLSLREWLEGRPAVLALWATWCGPCLVEKPIQARMADRLEQAGARARILLLQTFDPQSLDNGRRILTRLGADHLPNARATPDAEAAFVSLFGASPRTPTRTSMPALLLIGADGAQLGRAIGTMAGVNGRTDYWEDEPTFDFLSRL